VGWSDNKGINRNPNQVPLFQPCCNGSQGPTGPTGPAARDGVTGPRGWRGFNGATGPVGPRGATGSTQIVVQGSEDPYDDPTNGSVTIDTGNKLRFWSYSLFIDIQPDDANGALVELELNDMNNSSQVGPTGPQGQIGATGPIGLKGPTGPPGSSDVQFFTFTATTVDAAPTIIASIPTIPGTVYSLQVRTESLRQISGAESAVFFIKAGYKNIGTVLTRVGSADGLDIFSDLAASSWGNYTVPSGQNIIIYVVGEAGKTVNWKTTYSIVTL
jgi:hypothetical protein